MPGLVLSPDLGGCPAVSRQNQLTPEGLETNTAMGPYAGQSLKVKSDGDGTCQKASCFSDWWVFWFQMYTIFTGFFTSLLPCSFRVCCLLQMGLLLLSCTLCTSTQQVSCSTHLSSLAPQDFKLNKLSCSGERCHSPLLKALPDLRTQ